MEITVSNDAMIVLRSLSAYGLMPRHQAAKVDARFCDDVANAVRKVVDFAFRESAVAVVDCCSDAASVIASRLLTQETGDKGQLRKKLALLTDALATECKKNVPANAPAPSPSCTREAKATSRRPRASYPPDDDDVEFAIRAVALVVRELGWAASRS